MRWSQNEPSLFPRLKPRSEKRSVGEFDNWPFVVRLSSTSIQPLKQFRLLILVACLGHRQSASPLPHRLLPLIHRHFHDVRRSTLMVGPTCQVGSYYWLPQRTTVGHWTEHLAVFGLNQTLCLKLALWGWEGSEMMTLGISIWLKWKCRSPDLGFSVEGKLSLYLLRAWGLSWPRHWGWQRNETTGWRSRPVLDMWRFTHVMLPWAIMFLLPSQRFTYTNLSYIY